MCKCLNTDLLYTVLTIQKTVYVMKKDRRPARRFDDQFRLSVLKEFYESGAPCRQIARKYGVGSANIMAWEKKYLKKSVSLPSDIQELERLVFMAKKSRDERLSQPQSEELRLREENARLRKALEYSELRNEALHEVLKIGVERYGIDLLKKAGAKQ